MGETAYPSKRTFFKTADGGGFTDIDQVTSSGDPSFQSGDPSTLFPALPSTGHLVRGTIYSYSGGMVIVEQDHDRTIYAPEDTPALFSVYRANTEDMDWVANEQVIAGDKRNYEGKTYQCIQSHQTLSTWTPDVTPALWKLVSSPFQEWTYPVSYSVNDIVTYLGLTYKCLQAHTSISTWSPTATINVLWQLQS